MGRLYAQHLMWPNISFNIHVFLFSRAIFCPSNRRIKIMMKMSMKEKNKNKNKRKKKKKNNNNRVGTGVEGG